MKKNYRLNVAKRSSLLFGIIAIFLFSSFDEGKLLAAFEGPLVTAVPGEEWDETADSLQMATYSVFLGTGGVFNHDNQGRERFNYWWNAHMVDALVDGYLRTKDDAYLPKIKALVRGIKKRNNNSYQIFYNDDMEWLGISCLRAYKATGDAEYKEVADFLWKEVKKGWNPVHGGGIMWRTDTPEEKNACSNGPGALLALKMYEASGKDDDLEWAKKIYEWEKETLVDPLTGLVWDNISTKNGETVINKELVLTYNQGTYIGAATELFEITGKEQYLHDAWKTTNALMTSPKLTFEGILRDEGQGDRGLFKGILVRYLAHLAENKHLEESKKNRLLDFLARNVNVLNHKGIDGESWLVGPDWAEKPMANTDFSTQLSGVMLVEMAARLELPRREPEACCEDANFPLVEHLNIAPVKEANPLSSTSEKDFLIVVLGSSTAEGMGPSKKENAWVNRYSEYLKSTNSNGEIVNLARGGYQTKDVLPSGDPERNIIKALSYAPDAIIINLPSNDAAQDRPVEEQMGNYKKILAEVSGTGIPVWITTPQPRNFEKEKVNIQKDMVDASFARFGEPFVIDLWTCFSDENGHVKEEYDSGDGIHLNDAAHKIIFERVVAERIPDHINGALKESIKF